MDKIKQVFIPAEQGTRDNDIAQRHDAHQKEELAALRSQLANQSQLQQARAAHHQFERISLPGSQPASRVSANRRYLHAGSVDHTPRTSPPSSAVHSPPLTPAATQSRDGGNKLQPPTSASAVRPPHDIMTPQRSASPARNDTAGPVSSHPKQQPAHSLGPAGDSQPPSKDVSPTAGTPASTAPGTPRPFTPTSDASKATGKRQSQQVATSDPYSKYRFGDRDPAQGYANSGQGPPLPGMPTLPTSGSGTDIIKAKKRSSFFGGRKDHNDSSLTVDDKGHHHSSSKSNLKRFFKGFGSDHKHKKEEKDLSSRSNGGSSGTRTPTHTNTGDQPSVPFADDHGLQSKYGKFGKMLGSGAGGSVRLMKRSGDGTVFAVKQFRDRHAYESEREYNKKVTAEFCIGSTLHHGNVIETIDIVHEKGKWYEVMEYAPYDLFATVMAGKMGREEITCATLQILSGVLYLHSMGLAHRDLKLDNVVISEHGIMKLIDFGSAVVFRYPFESEIVLASGVVGSDPYLAPEVYDQARYDPRPADIWSIAIIFCCMTLRRFPWKAPRISDNSYRLFISPPDPDQDKLLDSHRRSTAAKSTTAPPSRNPSGDDTNPEHKSHHHHHHHHHHNGGNQSASEPASRTTTASNTDSQPTIKGPVRLLRLLPRETRHIIGSMLELDPNKRATMDDILADPWVQNALVCRQQEDGEIVKAPNHTHTLQPSNAS
ncbi:nitrogen permease reactivator protein NPR1 [Pseudocercospora fijiensis CIRAD86]|uniref:non-specific serine/threonine protein kinase n=1 Tax=Pseudocercospora fijiensis (strain CIRAD86) TaxID=383855 RepID=M3AME4_PSEFD|nr:nitrogen permease reactivator protein NPR1 [Pseudocercospora fijiensis CIRAD86]EME78278.1 nitrogen permease reactivator protein NPR1 [Pseudocercospora fijiensis CIRAD86]